MTKALSPLIYLEALEAADPAFIGTKFLELLKWQAGKGMPFYSGGWYARIIHRDWQVEAQQRRVAAEPKRTKSQPSALSDLLQTAMGAEG